MSKKKKVEAVVNLFIPSQKAVPSPPIGPALGQRGVNSMAFCKEFNARTADMTEFKAGMLLSVAITIYGDKSFSFEVFSPPTAELIKEATGVAKGSKKPNVDKIATLTKEQVKKIAEMKADVLTAANEQAAIRTIAGTARSMGVLVEGVSD